MAEPSDQSKRVFPPDAKWPVPTPFDIMAYRPDLSPFLDIPRRARPRTRPGRLAAMERAVVTRIKTC